MRYPKAWRKLINATAWFSGGMAFLVGIIQVMEVVMRYFFKSPTSWSLTICGYCVCYALFFGSSYAFQEQGHVAVDMIRDFADKHDKSGKRISRRALAVFGYLGCAVYIVALFYGTWILLSRGLKYNTFTGLSPSIPIWIMYLPIVVSIVLMMVTIIFMVLDIFAGGEHYM